MEKWARGIGLGLALVGLWGGLPGGIGAPPMGRPGGVGEAPPVSAATTPSFSVFLPLVLRAPEAPPAPWLSRLNAYRAMASLPPVTEELSWSDGCGKHARYMVKNDVIGHSEDPGNQWYTPEGDACARNANVMVSTDATAPDAYAIDVWMQAPFHAVGMLDPRLARVGYGSYREMDGGWQMGAALDVLRGWRDSLDGIRFPIRWPGDGTTTFLRAFQVGEYPDPLAHCGYTSPAGLPLLLLLGTGAITPAVTDHRLLRDGSPVDHCVFDETTFTHPDPNQQRIGRAVLNSRDAVVVIPREPLPPGTRYTVSLTVNGQIYTWSFSVDATAGAMGTEGPAPIETR